MLQRHSSSRLLRQTNSFAGREHTSSLDSIRIPVINRAEGSIPHFSDSRQNSIALQRQHSGRRLSLQSTQSNECEDDAELTLGKLPPSSERLQSGDFSKLCQEEWQPRFLVLTSLELFIAIPGNDEISDKIPLYEIQKVTKVQENPLDVLSERSCGAEELAFNIHTVPQGYNCGREYCFRADSRANFETWFKSLTKTYKEATKKYAKRTLIENYRVRAMKITNSTIWQRSSSLFVAANLVVNIAQSQASPTQGTGTMAVFDSLDIAFTVVFTIELSLNLFAHWFRPFFSNGWHVFDLIVVAISLTSVICKNLPGVSILRLMRTFRVLRLFNKLRSLRTLINALASSIVPVCNAFVIMVLVCVVYSILGVELFEDRIPASFGSFAISAYTMFQVSTVDGWTGLAERMQQPQSTGVDPVVACFFCTFIVIVSWVLLPVVVAVLLDNFIRAVNCEKLKAFEEEEQARMKALGISRADIGNPLDPLLEALSRFKNSALDVDVVGGLEFPVMQEGLRKMTHLKPQIYLSNDDFQRLTRNGTLCNSKGQIDLQNFEIMIRDEVERFIHNKISLAYDDTLQNGNMENSAVLAGLKLLSIKESSKADCEVNEMQEEEKPTLRVPDSIKQAALLERLFGIMHDELHEMREELRGELRDLRTDVRNTQLGLAELEQELQQGRNVAVAVQIGCKAPVEQHIVVEHVTAVSQARKARKRSKDASKESPDCIFEDIQQENGLMTNEDQAPKKDSPRQVRSNEIVAIREESPDLAVQAPRRVMSMKIDAIRVESPSLAVQESVSTDQRVVLERPQHVSADQASRRRSESDLGAGALHEERPESCEISIEDTMEMLKSLARSVQEKPQLHTANGYNLTWSARRPNNNSKLMNSGCSPSSPRNAAEQVPAPSEPVGGGGDLASVVAQRRLAMSQSLPVHMRRKLEAPPTMERSTESVVIRF